MVNLRHTGEKSLHELDKQLSRMREIGLVDVKCMTTANQNMSNNENIAALANALRKIADRQVEPVKTLDFNQFTSSKTYS